MAKGRGQGPKGMMDQLQKMQKQLEEAQEQLAEEMVEVTTGGGAVRIKMSGTQQCHQVTIDPELLAEGDAEMLQDLILLAINQAIHESQVVAARKLGPLSGGLGQGMGLDL
ncbi:MAG: YbaB/EbfC family nucleoid-associated protein [Anaerolineales bacterium]